MTHERAQQPTATQQLAPCRLTVLLARQATVGVIFRRGPSDWVQLIKWDTQTDAFELGQWFHGHIYVGRSDLSPNGSLLIYFANKFNRKTIEAKEYTYTWTAISKPPYLTALALWPKGDCWHGGGLFTADNEVFLNHRPEAAVPHPAHKPKGLHIKSNPQAVGEDDPIMQPRMERDGWKFLQRLEYDYLSQRTVQPCIFEKIAGDFSLRVEKFYDGTTESWLCSMTKDGNNYDIGVGTWVDVDHRKRIVFASEGKLHTAQIAAGKCQLSEIADFNGQKPHPLPAPAWATRW